MRERPILFSAPMVLALLDGSKTQTRRVIKLPHKNPLGVWEPTTVGGDGVKFSDGKPVPEWIAIWHTRTGETICCPHGIVGDQLWVKETWRTWESLDQVKPSLLEIIDIRIERINEISQADAFSEGIRIVTHDNKQWIRITGKYPPSNYLKACGNNVAIAEYASLWESINGAGSWNTNPWVWVVEFKVIKP